MNTLQQSLMNILAAYEVEIQRQENDKRLGYKDADPDCLKDLQREFALSMDLDRCESCTKWAEITEGAEVHQCRECEKDEREDAATYEALRQVR